MIPYAFKYSKLDINLGEHVIRCVDKTLFLIREFMVIK